MEKRVRVSLLCFIILIALIFSCESKPKQIALQGPFQKENGYCWIVSLPQYESSADSMKDGSRSKLLLYENGKVLGPAHSLHAEIRTNGLGRYSHWVGSIYFSTSDNSDPNNNGKKYTFVIPQ